MPDVRRQRRSRLTWWRLVKVVRYTGPSGEESAEPLGICGLSKRGSIGDFNNFANLNKAVFA
jgi:hypothetical protein